MERNFTLNFPTARLPCLIFLSLSLSFSLFQSQLRERGEREITFRDSPLLSLQRSKSKTTLKLPKKSI